MTLLTAARPLGSRSARPTRPALVPWTAALAMLALALLSPGVLSDGDTLMHIAAGDWILAHGTVPHTDPFSHSMAGAPWVPHEWLAEVALALAHGAAGLSGVMVLTGAAAGAAFFQLARHLGRWVPAGPALLLLLLAGAVVAPGLLARPHILALPFLEAWVAGLFIARSEGRAPSPWLLPVLCAWANLHGGYVFGLALLGPLGLEALLAAPQDWRRTVLRWGGFGLAGVCAALLTPHGLDGLLFPFQLLGLQELAMINEWSPTRFEGVQPLEVALVAGLYVALTRGARLPPLRLLLLLGLLHLSLTHRRHQVLVGMVAPLLLAEPLGLALRARRGGAGSALDAAPSAMPGAGPGPVPDGPVVPVPGPAGRGGAGGRVDWPASGSAMGGTGRMDRAAGARRRAGGGRAGGGAPACAGDARRECPRRGPRCGARGAAGRAGAERLGLWRRLDPCGGAPVH